MDGRRFSPRPGHNKSRRGQTLLPRGLCAVYRGRFKISPPLEIVYGLTSPESFTFSRLSLFPYVLFCVSTPWLNFRARPSELKRASKLTQVVITEAHTIIAVRFRRQKPDIFFLFYGCPRTPRKRICSRQRHFPNIPDTLRRKRYIFAWANKIVHQKEAFQRRASVFVISNCRYTLALLRAFSLSLLMSWH